MILMVSGRCDIIAFYSKWFINRMEEGFFDVRNPFNKKLVSRIYTNDIDLFMFCTKNPIPIINYLSKIDKPILFHVTITPYGKDIEPNVIDKKKIIEGVKEVSKIVGIDNLYIRYDPIFLSDKYNLNYHLKAFTKLCRELNGYTKHIIVSFLDIYKNVIHNKDLLKYKSISTKDLEVIGREFSRIAKENNMTVQTCFEKANLVQFGFIKDDCLSKEITYRLTGKNFPKWKARRGNSCNCREMVDIGAYNTCHHLCRYCYANYNEEEIESNIKNHDPKSSLLIGHLEEDDIIKIRKK